MFCLYTFSKSSRHCNCTTSTTIYVYIIWYNKCNDVFPWFEFNCNQQEKKKLHACACMCVCVSLRRRISTILYYTVLTILLYVYIVMNIINKYTYIYDNINNICVMNIHSNVSHVVLLRKQRWVFFFILRLKGGSGRPAKNCSDRHGIVE